MKVAVLGYLKYNNFNSIQSGLSVNYFGNNSNVHTFPLSQIAALGSGATVVVNNTTDVSISHYIVNTPNTTLLQRYGFEVSSGKLDLSTSYGNIIDTLTVSTSSFNEYSINLQENGVSNLAVYIASSTLPTKGAVSVYLYIPEVSIDNSKYTIKPVTPQPVSLYVYVANSISNTISVIQISNNKIIATIPVESAPYGIAATPDGNYVYVTNSSSNTVSVIQVSTNTVIATVAVETSPEGIAVTPDGNYVYVTNNGSNTVSVIRVSTNTVIETISIESSLLGGARPQGIAVTPDGNYVYVTDNNPNGNTVSVIQVSTNTVIDTITVEGNPYGIAITPDGSYGYVTNQGSNTVSVIRLSTNTVIDTISVQSEPTGVVVSPDGNYVYVVYYNTTALSVIDVSTNTVNTFTEDVTSFGVVVTANGDYLYIPSFRSSFVYVIETSTKKTVDTINIGSRSFGGIAIISVPL